VETDFSHADHTVVVSDIHLADAEPPHPKNPLWKRFKRPEYFVDKSFKSFLEYLSFEIAGAVELVLNGDIFDFDSVMALPRDASFHVGWLEKKRGLSSEEEKSKFKIKTILEDHRVWVEGLKEFILRGNRIVFVIGNHDIELQWPSVQQAIVAALDLPDPLVSRVRFCEWFYISNQDTLIEHGNQYDAYSLCSNPINPLIKKGHKVYVRIPFGNLAGKFMLNGIGLMNPHSEGSYIKSSIKEYLVFYFKYVITTQPFLLLTWFWSAFVTLVYSVTEGLLPPMTDPLTVDSRVEAIANRSNATTGMVWALKELHVHPAIYNPFKILRELWLDRAIMLVFIFFVSFQFFSFLNVFVAVSFWWFLLPLVLLMPLFVFYAKSIESEVMASQEAAFHSAPISARITKVKRVIQGHTHREVHTWVDGIEYLNTGTWSPAYVDVECTQPYGRKCFAWVNPHSSGKGRVSELLVWEEKKMKRVAPKAAA